MARLERRQEQERNKAEIAAELIKRGADIGAEESKVLSFYKKLLEKNRVPSSPSDQKYQYGHVLSD